MHIMIKAPYSSEKLCIKKMHKCTKKYTFRGLQTLFAETATQWKSEDVSELPMDSVVNNTTSVSNCWSVSVRCVLGKNIFLFVCFFNCWSVSGKVCAG